LRVTSRGLGDVYKRQALYTSDADGNLLRLNMHDARILRDILTEHIARQDRKPA
jgi:hypothetical protein